MINGVVIPIGWYVRLKKDAPNRRVFRRRLGIEKRAYKVLGYRCDKECFCLIVESVYGLGEAVPADYLEPFCDNRYRRIVNK